ADGACAPHPAWPCADRLHGTCLLPSAHATCRRRLAAPAWVDWHLQPNPYRYVATHRCPWPVPWGDCGERVARRVICCRCFGVTDPLAMERVSSQQLPFSVFRWWLLVCAPLPVVN